MPHLFCCSLYRVEQVAGLGWAGLGWAGLGWGGLGWVGIGACVEVFVHMLLELLSPRSCKRRQRRLVQVSISPRLLPNSTAARRRERLSGKMGRHRQPWVRPLSPLPPPPPPQITLHWSLGTGYHPLLSRYPTIPTHHGPGR
jgi:hypothetical protein